MSKKTEEESNYSNLTDDEKKQYTQIDIEYHKKNKEQELVKLQAYDKWAIDWMTEDNRQITKINQSYENTVQAAKEAFNINKTINIAIVVIGIALIINSIVYSWSKGLDVVGLISGGLGVGTTISIFFRNPQHYINKAAGNLAQITMIYKTHSLFYDTAKFYMRDRIDKLKEKNGYDENSYSKLQSEIIAFYKELEETTEKYVKQIQTYVEDKEKDINNTDSSPQTPSKTAV